jgi:hypothetical protein
MPKRLRRSYIKKYVGKGHRIALIEATTQAEDIWDTGSRS